MKKIFLITVPLILLIVHVYTTEYTTAAIQGSCITCHTSEGILKKLCKLPQVPAGEGEG